MKRSSYIKISLSPESKYILEDRFNSLIAKMGLNKYGSGSDIKIQALEIGLTNLEKKFEDSYTQTIQQGNSQRTKKLFIHEFKEGLKAINETNPIAHSISSVMKLFLESKESVVFGDDLYNRTQISWLYKLLTDEDIFLLDLRFVSQHFKDIYLIHRESPFFLQLYKFIYKFKIHPRCPNSTQQPHKFYDTIYRIINLTGKGHQEVNTFEWWVINKLYLIKGIINQIEKSENDHIFKEIWDLNMVGKTFEAKELMEKTQNE